MLHLVTRIGTKNFGQLEKFKSRTDSFQEKANLYFEVNGIKEEKQFPVFLSPIGEKSITSCGTYWLPHYQGTNY